LNYVPALKKHWDMMFYMISFLLDPILAFIWARKVVSKFPVKRPDINSPA
jgi:hypothetical protein